MQAQLDSVSRELSLGLSASDSNFLVGLFEGTLSTSGRFFHNVGHVLQVAEHGDGTARLAALFHDLIYIQLDGGIAPSLLSYVAPFIVLKDAKVFLAPAPSLEKNFEASRVVEVFGFTPGQELINPGVNEFLSALAASQILSPFASMAQILEVAACIELTIAFRPRSKGSSASAAERLHQRLEQINTNHNLGMAPNWISSAVCRAVKMANYDVSDFSGGDAARLVKNSWQLLRENTPELRPSSNCPWSAFRGALLKMEKFFSTLDPDSIFQNFGTEPGSSVFDRLNQEASLQVTKARDYFRVILSGLALIESAQAEEGGEPPLSVLASVSEALGAQNVERNIQSSDPRALLLQSFPEDFPAAKHTVRLALWVVQFVGWECALKAWPDVEAYLVSGRVNTKAFTGLGPVVSEKLRSIGDSLCR